MSTAATALVRRTTCPHCWTTFPPEDILWVSAHADLRGDPRLGPDAQQRFLPTRFNIEGNALDARGFVCQVLACPHCHLVIPRPLLENELLFVSILGGPGSGKSCFLAALTWELRRILPLHFALAFADADPVLNRSLIGLEEALFLNSQPEQQTPLARLIPKTEAGGDFYDSVWFGNQSVCYPRPFLFSLKPQPNHPALAAGRRLERIVCLYDNAGQDFLAGQDTPSNPVTHHLAQSRLVLYLFDPTQDARFRKFFPEGPLDSVDSFKDHTAVHQEVILHEAATRVRRLTGRSEGAKIVRTLVVVLTKADAWISLADNPDWSEPWMRQEKVFGLDADRIKKRSQEMQDLLRHLCPEIVAAAESIGQRVLYVPVSALGRSSACDWDLQTRMIRPAQIKPSWVTVPLLYGLSREISGIVRRYGRKPATVPDVNHSAASPLSPADSSTWWENYSEI